MQVSMQIALLERRSISELQEIWKKYFDAPPTTYNKEFYISRIAHRIQELAYGGLSANQQKLIANMYNVCQSTLYKFVIRHALKVPVVRKLDGKKDKIIEMFRQGMRLHI